MTEREEFEAMCCKRWGGDRSALTIREDGEYVTGPIQFGWICWQAARASSTQGVVGELVVTHFEGGMREFHITRFDAMHELPEGTHRLYSAPQSEDDVIERCAAVCDKYHGSAAAAIRALKSAKVGA